MARLLRDAILKDRVYLPFSKNLRKLAKRHYEFRMFKEALCKKCDVYNNGERFNDICATCTAYNGNYKLWNETTLNNKRYITLPKGDLKKVESRLDISLKEATDKRACPPMKNQDLKMTAKLFTNQKEKVEGGFVKRVNQRRLVKEWLKHKTGMIQAPPRSGKTFLGVRIAQHLKTKTLVIAHESMLLTQFYKTIYKYTNAKELEAKTGKKIAGIVKSMKDFREDWDFVLVTYQKFIRKNSKKRIAKYLRGNFGLLILDECHLSSAPAFSEFAANMDSKYVLGLTATPKRKDGLEKLAGMIVGPVVVKGENVGMKPLVEVHDTKLAPKTDWRGMSAYTKAVSWTSMNKERNAMLVRQVFADLRADKRHNIIIPVERRSQAALLVKMINKQAAINNEKREESWNENLARMYIGGVNKERVISHMQKGKGTRVLVAMRKMCKLGLDIEALTHMYLQTPINNAPDFYQLTQRICTFYPNKPQPVLRYYVDRIGISQGCFRSSWWNGVVALKYYFTSLTSSKVSAMLGEFKSTAYRTNAYSNRYRKTTQMQYGGRKKLHVAKWS